MLSDAPNPSWHPALMPNWAGHLPQGPPHRAASRPAHEGGSAGDGSRPAVDSDHADEGFGAWVPGDTTTADAVLAEFAFRTPVHDRANTLKSSDADNAPANSPDESESPEDAVQNETSAASKHFSTMSFARTVSHEVSWTDDDDTEWNSPTTGTDPFKFLPESNRTNSFPPVPPLEKATPNGSLQTLPSDEAEDLVREIEREEADKDALIVSAASGTPPRGFDAPDADGDYSSHQYIGGCLSGTAEEAQQGRFDEAVPLVPPAGQDAPHEGSGEGGHDLFGEDATGEEDDFFSNVQGAGDTQHGDLQPPPTLTRKSTMDVLNSLNMGTVGIHLHPLDETAEEAETEAEQAQRLETEALAKETPEDKQDQPKAEDGENLDAKWKEMFADGDDEDLLPDEYTETKELDPTAFLGSDDEGLLDDSEIQPPEPEIPSITPAVPATQLVNGQHLPLRQTPATPSTNAYLRTASPVTAAAANSYLPAGGLTAVRPPVPTPLTGPSSAPPLPNPYGYGAPPPLQEKNKAQSFADKAKGGYTSPYDLPMEVVKPPKRGTSAQPLHRNTSAPNPLPATIPPPARSASVQPHRVPPSSGPPAGVVRPGSSHSGHSTQEAPSTHKPSHEAFFEELPITAKPRPASRHSQKSLPSPSEPSPSGLTAQSAPPSVTSHLMHPPGPSAPAGPEADITKLVAPPPVNPYASLSSAPSLPAAAPPARYSPASAGTPHANGVVPAPALTRYSPAPAASRQPSGSYGQTPTTTGPPLLPHQPRTSSPLAHFEISHERSRAHAPATHGESGLSERRSNNSFHEFRLQRLSSLPPTREVEEEEIPVQARASPGHAPPAAQPTSPPASRYAPPSQRARQTPPPPSVSGQALFSPPKPAMPSHSPLAASHDFAPPPRSQTQSPGALCGSRGTKPADPVPRPSPDHDPTSPQTVAYPPAPISHVPATASSSATYTRPRGSSLNLNVIPPTDGREHDPLQRWRGAPLVSWGVGGTFVTMFPKEVPRYGMNQSTPAVVRSPGEVKIHNMKDITPLEERLAKFPGPLKGKSKKKEAVAWLTTGIESLERGLPNNLSLFGHLCHEDKRAVERVLLWKILRLLVEHDGVLEGNPAVDKSVREILMPGLETSESAPPYMNGGVANLGLGDSLATGMQPDAVSSSTVEQIRRHLLNGDCEKAVWAAVDQRLWGHALLVSNALAPNLYKQVAQEFVKKEVNFPGHSNESLAALYEVLSGNHEESVDELVPVHARAGLQLVAKDAASGPSKDSSEGLDKWRETLCLILSNRSADDVRAINSLGVLLSGYGRAEAAHICFMFARSHTVFGGLDDPNSHFVLVGSDHKKQAEQFAKEIEPLLLSEVYEYGQSLAGGSNVPITNPHLAAYKLQHALDLAEYGFRDKALQYCDAIASAITSQTRRSPYHHPILENAVGDLMGRLKQSPKEGSSSWIPKPSMNKVSDTMWNRFNKFVSGEDDGSGQGSPGETESGPFALVAGGTPAISPSPSVNNLETFGAAVPNYGVPPPLANGPVAASAPPPKPASRYAPATGQPAGTSNKPYGPGSTYAPRSSMERTSSELSRGSLELPRTRQSSEMQLGQAGAYNPASSGSPAAMYTPYGAEYGASPESPYNPASQQPPVQTSGTSTLQSVGPGAANGAPPDQGSEGSPGRSREVSGYQPPSYGYEPPSFTPHEPPAEKKVASDNISGGNAYEPPSYQPYSYEPPSYEPEPQPSIVEADSDESKPKPKKKGIMYDDEDDIPTPRPAVKTKEEKDRESAERFRKAAEEDAKRAAEAAKQTKKGWGFTSWFGGGAKKDAQQESSPNKPVRAKLGEPNSFYYDPELKRWVNKNSGPDDAVKKATPPPPKSAIPRSVNASPALPPSAGAGPETGGRASAPPTGPPPRGPMTMTPPPPSGAASASDTNLPSSGAPPPPPPPPGPVSMLRSASNTSTASAPPMMGRPLTGLSNSSSIDDLLGAAAGPRKPGPAARKGRKGARYVDVMGKS